MALLSSRRLWPAPITAPLAAFPPIAPNAAPFAAPLALGWAGCFGGGCVAAGGVCAGGGVCASAAGSTALERAITKDRILAERFIPASFLAGLLCPGAQCLSYLHPGGGTTQLLALLAMMLRLSCRCFLNRFHMLIGSGDPVGGPRSGGRAVRTEEESQRTRR